MIKIFRKFKKQEWLLLGLAIVFIAISVWAEMTMPEYMSEITILVQTLTDNLNRVTRENLTGLRVVRAYNAEAYQEKKSERANGEMTSANLFAQRTMAFIMPSIQLVMNGISLAIYWIGALLINAAKLTDKIVLFSDMMVFSSYAIQVVMSFMMLVMIFILLPRALVFAERINEVLDTEPTIRDGSVTEGKAGERGEVEFRGVSFRYPDAEENVLTDISFAAHQGETVAIIGSTDCGKSTAVNLIPRFYDATEGQVLVDGVDVRDYTQKALRNKIGYVSQKATLFTGTISSNIAYGDNGRAPADLNTVKDAASTAQAAEFIEKLSDGYDGYVAQGGSNLSGGQKQRLSIARAIARDPEILIFDDSFSALDYKTDRILRKTLDEKCRNITRIIVAQRIGTIRDADRIIVLDDGKIVGQGGPAGSGEKAKDLVGTWKKLLGYCRRYSALIVVALVCAAAGTVLTLIGPDRLLDMTDAITDGVGFDTEKLSDIIGQISENITENFGIVMDAVASNMKGSPAPAEIEVNGSAIPVEDQSLTLTIIGGTDMSDEAALRQAIESFPESVRKALFTDIVFDGVTIGAADQAELLKAIPHNSRLTP